MEITGVLQEQIDLLVTWSTAFKIGVFALKLLFIWIVYIIAKK